METSVGREPSEITSAIDPGTGVLRIGKECRSGKIWLTPIGQCQIFTPHCDLANGSRSGGPPVVIQNQNVRSPGGVSGRNQAATNGCVVIGEKFPKSPGFGSAERTEENTVGRKVFLVHLEISDRDYFAP